jgi:hypothetical protein
MEQVNQEETPPGESRVVPELRGFFILEPFSL